ncbi:MAG: cytidine deaminase [Chloroflexia bacterium]|jgi:cytidine deaminase|nr:cytidine deaminase [Chloroflexia bacterium]
MNDEELIQLALDARARAYVPYSHFRVGAALLAGNGEVYTGCNVENGAYSPTICAERVAIGAAIAAGETPGKPGSFTTIAVAADNAEPTSPCGVCRQVLFELAPGLRVIMVAAPELGEGRVDMSVEELLPMGFRFPDAQG